MRHKDNIRLRKVRSQEAIRWRSTNGESLTSHIAELEAFIKEYNIGARRLCNMDESGISP